MNVFNRIQQLLAESFERGENVQERLLDLVDEHIDGIKEAAIDKLYKKHLNVRHTEWAGDPGDGHQLRFFVGEDLVHCIDKPVRVVDHETGEETYKPARYSTYSERTVSLQDVIQYHHGQARVHEQYLVQEQRTAQTLLEHGLDPELTWDEIRHANTTCWRCGNGYQHGDYFVQGHCEGAAALGGTAVKWEHNSCNSSAQQNG